MPNCTTVILALKRKVFHIESSSITCSVLVQELTEQLRDDID